MPFAPRMIIARNEYLDFGKCGLFSPIKSIYRGMMSISKWQFHRPISAKIGIANTHQAAYIDILHKSHQHKSPNCM